MDFTAVQQLITSLGFPVACVLGLGWFVYKMWNNNREDMQLQMKRLEENSKSREDKLHE